MVLLIHRWEDKGVHSFPKRIYPKVNVIVKLNIRAFSRTYDIFYYVRPLIRIYTIPYNIRFLTRTYIVFYYESLD